MNAYITPDELKELSNLDLDPKAATNLIKEASAAIDAEVMPNIIDPNNVDDDIKQAVAWMCEHINANSEFEGMGLFRLGDLTIGGQSENSNNMIPAVPSKVINLLLSSGWLYAGVGGDCGF
ncbi:hypothetical protein ED407_03040 [Listeria monocytogenes]|uniref:hypothetical protein n=1 Tax=Listeria monocytogenes TaxID=1639 RepID=UPI000C83A5C8|nr:hypothetical protein [Listeria monocytogenes]EAD5308182.1 hypothetical protein [Listeria monocytogenes]EAD5322756.1 hypothetical protein [Listeria monocytogenes]EAE8567874.1 hypothetical protein [Listeria monocytogenes]EAE9197208.1 hypothetical protein [Listeria monocytogenes]EAE9206278.1 hypothetical protein [Listeria monocytogenes]